MSAFNLTDTWFVSRLGTQALAAMSFTFPVVMVVGAMAMGIGLGVSAGLSRAIGEGDHHKVQRLATDSLLLAMLVVGFFACVGLLTMDPVFRMLGATEEILPMVKQYMTIWYSCVAVLVLPMVGNNALRATGDTMTPSLIMVAMALLNAILDPIFIFGLFGFPRLELQGAALATVIARSLSMVGAMLVMHYRCHLLDLTRPRIREVMDSWRRILHVGVPAAATNLLFPVANGIILRMVAGYGEAAVAGTGAAQRVLHFSYIVPIALGTALVPFVGQNWGAGQHDRVKAAWKTAIRFGMAYGLTSFVLSLPAARPVAGLFSGNPEVMRVISVYLWVILLASAMQHVAVHSGFAMNAIGHPRSAAVFNGGRMLCVIPLAAAGGWHFGLIGIYGGMALSQLLSGLAAMEWFRVLMRREARAKSLGAARPVCVAGTACEVEE